MFLWDVLFEDYPAFEKGCNFIHSQIFWRTVIFEVDVIQKIKILEVCSVNKIFIAIRVPGHFWHFFFHDLLSNLYIAREISLSSMSAQLTVLLFQDRGFLLLFFLRRPTTVSICNLLFCIYRKVLTIDSYSALSFSLMLLQTVLLIWCDFIWTRTLEL